MKKMILVSLLATCAFAGDFEDGLKAYAGSNFKEALAKFEAGCLANDVKSCVKVGAIYQLGKTTLPNPSKALEYYNKACEAGEVEGCSAAGGLYLNTESQKARELFNKACEKNDGYSCEMVGSILIEAKEFKKAYEFLVKGCELGDKMSCEFAGDLRRSKQL
ncbi:tetratricopeptide repeat protein [Campylobacter concisus]|uniref:tetratricopeptide repeat protein n=1 Tax=Campylobacter concisus TaxID=199 RepID=UPI000CD88244|nr:tetratricopeptide repeat protein [Campylobacter concisus]